MIEIKNIRKQFGDVQAIHDMSADIREGGSFWTGRNERCREKYISENCQRYFKTGYRRSADRWNARI